MIADTCSRTCDLLEALLNIETDASELGIHVAYTLIWGEPVSSDKTSILDNEVNRLIDTIKELYTLEGLRNNNIIRAYRDFYWRISIDPTKVRPSSEALVRRIIRRGDFPRINPIVDVGNIASAKTLVPIGLYDWRFFEPPVSIRLSRGSEVFEPIGGAKEVLAKGIPILVDNRGLVMHLYPHRDSRVTMLREDTRCVLVLGAGVPRVERRIVVKAVEESIRLASLLGWKACGQVRVKP